MSRRRRKHTSKWDRSLRPWPDVVREFNRRTGEDRSRQYLLLIHKRALNKLRVEFERLLASDQQEAA